MIIKTTSQRMGMGATIESEALIGSGGDNLVANTSKVFTPLGGAMTAVLIQNANGSGKKIKVKWNGTAVVASSVGGWDEELNEGELRSSPEGLKIARVALMADADSTNGTHFQVNGWY